MDLSFRFDRALPVSALPTDLAVLMVGVAARQAASPTARIQSNLARMASGATLLAPTHGAFNRTVETLLLSFGPREVVGGQVLTGWKDE